MSKLNHHNFNLLFTLVSMYFFSSKEVHGTSLNQDYVFMFYYSNYKHKWCTEKCQILIFSISVSEKNSLLEVLATFVFSSTIREKSEYFLLLLALYYAVLSWSLISAVRHAQKVQHPKMLSKFFGRWI